MTRAASHRGLPAPLLLPASLLLAALCWSCSNTPPVAPIDVEGHERLAWDQRAGSQAELLGLRFYLIIDDGDRSEAAGVACGDLRADSTSVYSIPLPPLTAGSHTLALQAVSAGGIESPRSSSLSVNMTRSSAAISPGSGARVSSASVVGRALRRLDTPTLSIRTVATGLSDATDLAVLPDGRVLVAERLGSVRLISGGVTQSSAALQLDDLSAPGSASGLLAIAADPAFGRTRHVYVAYTTDAGFRIARFREDAGRLGERVVVLDAVPTSAQPTAALRFGPDGLLYVALDDGGDPASPGDLGSYNGKVLRLNPDGTVPRTQPAFSPVLVPQVSAGRALAWAAGDDRLWIAEGRLPGTGILDVVGADIGGTIRGRIVSRHRPPRSQVPSSLVGYRGALIRAWTGDLLMALPDDQQLVRIRPDRTDPTRVAFTEVVASGSMVGRILAMGVDAAGMVYLANDDRVLSLGPANAPP